jgi:hypothetical protein
VPPTLKPDVAPAGPPGRHGVRVTPEMLRQLQLMPEAARLRYLAAARAESAGRHQLDREDELDP